MEKRRKREEKFWRRLERKAEKRLAKEGGVPPAAEGEEGEYYEKQGEGEDKGQETA